MGGGNGQKAATARARKMKLAQASGGGSQLESNSKAMNILCNICKQSFVSTAKEATLKMHSDSKHPKQTFADCFPGFQS